MEVFPEYPYSLVTFNPFKRKKLLFKPARLSDFGLESSLPLELPRKKSTIIKLDVFTILSIADVLNSKVKTGIPVPSGRLVI